MRKARFTDEQMVAILREADRETPAVVAKRHKVSEQTIYNWRKKFGALGTDEVRRLKQLEVENGRLKKLVAERDLEIEVMKGCCQVRQVEVIFASAQRSLKLEIQGEISLRRPTGGVSSRAFASAQWLVVHGSPLTVAGAARGFPVPFESSFEEPVAGSTNTASYGLGKCFFAELRSPGCVALLNSFGGEPQRC